MKENNFFQDLSNTRPFLKMAFEGFAGTGKTLTSAFVAIGLHKQINSKKPIVYFDTEKRLKAVKQEFDKAKIQVKVRESRSLADLVKTIELCVAGFSDILVIDSISHVWLNFLEAYKKHKNRNDLYFQDWGVLKPEWKSKFSDILITSPIHIIFTGRAGFEYDYFENEATEKMELRKTGIKMKAETEMEYEPDIVVLMEKEKEMDKKTMKNIINYALVLKAPPNTINGERFQFPTYNNFKPAIDLLLEGEYRLTQVDETPDKFEDAEREYQKRKTDREIALDKITSTLQQLNLGTSKDDKKLKIDILEKIFDTNSWTEVDKKVSLEILNQGVKILNMFKQSYLDYLNTHIEQGTEGNINDILILLENSKSKILKENKNEL